MLSVIYPTNRLGGFDILINCLKNQTFKDWELIVVDDLPNRNLEELIKETGIPISYYGKSKEKHYTDTPYPFSNVFNTGLLKSSGDIAVFLQDYIWIPPESLARWDTLYRKSRDMLVTAIGKEISYHGMFNPGHESIFEPKFDGWKTFTEPDSGRFERTAFTTPGYRDGLFIPGRELITRTNKTIFTTEFDPVTAPGMELPYEFFYGAFPMEFFEDINGFDERCDYKGDFTHRVVVYQAMKRGYKFMVDLENYCYYVDHKRWKTKEDGVSNMFNAMENCSSRDKIKWEDVNWDEPNLNNFNLKQDRIGNKHDSD
ncbi:MAG TPA: glycosyltransferase family A protein [Smithellaceae bacterium]|nr:glycosyltransferase family A protein [Smithellaceae bacterium]